MREIEKKGVTERECSRKVGAYNISIMNNVHEDNACITKIIKEDELFSFCMYVCMYV